MANTPTPKERVETLEKQVQELTARTQTLELALSDLLSAMDRGTSKPGYRLNCPSPVTMAYLMVNHYDNLIQRLGDLQKL